MRLAIFARRPVPNIPLGTIAFWLSYPFIQVLARTPFALLWLLSDALYVIVYHGIGYRKAVVRENLRRSFPEKPPEELRAIERRFYRWFCDLWLETLKTLTLPPAEVERRMTVEDSPALRRHFNDRRSVILVMGHLGNWELGGARFSLLGLHQLFVIYHPLSNTHFERLIVRMRTRMGTRLLAMNDTLRGMLANRSQLTATAFIADQSPPPEGAIWVEFLHQDTPVFAGTERIARKLGQPVLYVHITRERRGFYRMRIDELVADPAHTAPGEVTRLHTARLEQDIRQQPELWLWTHRRWKHQRSTT